MFNAGKLSVFAVVALFLGLSFAAAAPAWGAVDGQCRAKGVRLYGKVKVVKSGADIKVKKVSAFPDLHVQMVKNFPDKCGKWQQVDAFPDFTVQFVDSFPDITIKYVTTFPGRP